MYAKGDERAAAGDVVLHAALHVEVVEVGGVVDDESSSGRECWPVGIDHVDGRGQGIEDEAEGDSE
ncbi:MAG: hypothetical protein E6J53_07895 [Chloroflexi bacterium]|nr:MAG: hypothetical protein E6J53_07895 [Chloroflexota bacterium]